MGQPIYFILFLLRFQKILEQKAASHKHPENRERPTPGGGPPPLGLPARPGPAPHSPLSAHLKSLGPRCEPDCSFCYSRFFTTSLLWPSLPYFIPVVVSMENIFFCWKTQGLKWKKIKACVQFSIIFWGSPTWKGPCPASTHLNILSLFLSQQGKEKWEAWDFSLLQARRIDLLLFT